ncbi:ParA family protein [Methylobacterium platani]|uniref:Chromosome partitioning protein n=2 Tax=Methylobacterium platani TaxID=427683 RepID=A0A179SFN2_9HYPH|nr:ParA family protein [Methylobacterium platani]KMO21382.1 chromosome partitioning protein [Methylobacterium platani JCM 14648]OAS26269.1 chromosome partitioning protein [Methylobacterium platani]
MSRIIGLVQSKGGVGKTTTALNLAAELARRGHSVRVLDADPEANAAATAKLGRLPFAVAAHLIEGRSDAGAWAKVVKDGSADYTVVDAPGAMGAAYGATVAVSDIVLVPAGATALELRGAANTVKFVRDFRRSRGGAAPEILVVPSRVDRRTVAGREAVATLASLTEPVSPPISSRQPVADSIAAGETVAAGSPSAAEYAALLDAVLTRLGVEVTA